ncbi:MAG: hypothetical protein ACTIDE_08995 [Carnobacterium maltaromaticum]
MIRRNSQLHKLYNYITLNHPSGTFTTEKIYQNAYLIGLNPTSISGSLYQLKQKGILSNSGGRMTSRGRVQKQWRLNKTAIITN